MISFRWATQGLEFIALACEPKNVVYLSDIDFQVSKWVHTSWERKKKTFLHCKIHEEVPILQNCFQCLTIFENYTKPTVV